MPTMPATACPICQRAQCSHKAAPRIRPGNWKQISRRVRREERSCRNCGSSERLMVDHIVPLSLGGTEARSNLRVLCHHCHNGRLDGLGRRANRA